MWRMMWLCVAGFHGEDRRRVSSGNTEHATNYDLNSTRIMRLWGIDWYQWLQDISDYTWLTLSTPGYIILQVLSTSGGQ